MQAAKPAISGAQIRAARAFLRWSVQELSQLCGVSESAIARAEKFDTVPGMRGRNLDAIRAAFEMHGIEFIDSGHFNNANGSTTNDELLVHNTADGHLYEWWIANNQLSGTDLIIESMISKRPAPGLSSGVGDPAAIRMATAARWAGGARPWRAGSHGGPSRRSDASHDPPAFC